MVKKTSRILSLIVLTALVVLQMLLIAPAAQAASLTGGSLSLSDSQPSQTTVDYTFNFTGVTATNIKCVQAVFATTASGSTMPTGMVTSGVSNGGGTLGGGFGSWTAASPVAGTVNLTNATGTTAGNGTVIFGDITNGSTDDTGYFARFNTFSDAACTTGVDSATVMFIYTSGQVVSVTVEPSLTFTISGVASGQSVNGATTNVATTSDTNQINFGTVVTPSTNAIAAHDLNVGTNSATGYSLSVRYNAPLTFGAATIADLATHTNAAPGAFSAAGTAAFGYTTNDATLGTGTAARFISNNWAAFDTSNYEVAYRATATTTTETTRVGYQVGISSSTPAGSYTNTIVYTATPTY